MQEKSERDRHITACHPITTQIGLSLFGIRSDPEYAEGQVLHPALNCYYHLTGVAK